MGLQFQTQVKAQWLNLKDAAKYIGRTEKAVRRLLDKNRLTVYKPDSRLVFSVQDLDRFIGSSSKGASASYSSPM
jgi:hypothetical protein